VECPCEGYFKLMNTSGRRFSNRFPRFHPVSHERIIVVRSMLLLVSMVA